MPTPDRIGTRAVDFDLPAVDGRRWSLQDFSGHWLLLVFHRHLA